MVYKSILFFTGWCVVCFTFLLSYCLCYKLTPAKLLQHGDYMGVLCINLEGWCFLHKGSNVLVVRIYLWSDTCWNFWWRSSKDGLTMMRLPDRADGLGAHICSCLLVCVLLFDSLDSTGLFLGPDTQLPNKSQGPSWQHWPLKKTWPGWQPKQTPTWCGLDPEQLCGL